MDSCGFFLVAFHFPLPSVSKSTIFLKSGSFTSFLNFDPFFLLTNDLSEVKNGEFSLDFKVFGKNRGVGDLKIKNKISKEKL